MCVQLLPSYPSFSLVTSTLHTLTTLAMATKIHIPDQVYTVTFPSSPSLLSLPSLLLSHLSLLSPGVAVAKLRWSYRADPH